MIATMSDWINKGVDMTAIEESKTLAKKLHNEKITITQLRNFYSEIVRLRMNSNFKANEAVMLIPKLHYVAARIEKKKGKLLIENLHEPLKKAVQDKKSFEIFATFMESLMAFFKYEEEMADKN